MTIPRTQVGRARRATTTTLAGLVAGSTLAVGVAAAIGAPATAATPHVTAYGGNAFGTSISLGSTAHSGRSAYVPLCTTSSGRSRDDKTVAVNVPNVGTIGAVTTRVASSRAGGVPKSTATSTTAATSLLGGMIAFTALKETVSVWHSATGFHHTATMTAVDLRIGGLPVNPTVPANSTMTVPGLATVYLNRQVAWTHGGSHNAAIAGMKIVLTGNSVLNIPAGTIYIGRAQASLHSATYARPYGSAYGTSISLASVLGSGPTAPVYLPCGGTGTGSTLTNDTAAVNIPGVLHVDAVSSAAYSRDSRNHSSTTASTRNHLAGVSIANGAVTVQAVNAVATATRKNGHLYRSTAGTGVAGLRIAGRAVKVGDKPNTKIAVPGLGTLWINRVVNDGTGVHAYGVQLVLSAAVGTHAAGSTITIAAANAGVHRS